MTVGVTPRGLLVFNSDRKGCPPGTLTQLFTWSGKTEGVGRLMWDNCPYFEICGGNIFVRAKGRPVTRGCKSFEIATFQVTAPEKQPYETKPAVEQYY
jgi:hypothetical protein